MLFFDKNNAINPSMRPRKRCNLCKLLDHHFAATIPLSDTVIARQFIIFATGHYCAYTIERRLLVSHDLYPSVPRMPDNMPSLVHGSLVAISMTMAIFYFKHNHATQSTLVTDECSSTSSGEG